VDELQERLARTALARIGDRGFVLAGGSAVVAHGLSSRATEDVDLFTNRMHDSTNFRAAVKIAVEGGMPTGWRPGSFASSTSSPRLR
jgi:predicted nucleotidyltransferase